MNEPTTHNLNDRCRVMLTSRGVDAIAKYYAECNAGPPAEYVGGQVFEGTLWEVMAMFGGCMYNGCDLPFQTTIELEKR